MGAGPGRIFPPADYVFGISSLVTLLLSALLMWEAGVLRFFVAVIVLALSVLCLVTFVCICVKLAIEAYGRRWPRG